MRQAVATNPMEMDFIEWNEVIGRIPELMAETDALYRSASVEERAILRKQLADDLVSIADESELRLSKIRRERHAVLRRWVAIRTGRDKG